MKRTFVKPLTAALTLATLATGASAKDWIDSFSLTNAGIDVTPVVVGASQGGYTQPNSPVRGFGLTLSGSVESGKRINGMTFGAGSGISVKESNIGQWDYSLTWGQLGNGDRRNLTVEVQFGMPLTSVAWQTRDPVEACEANMQAKLDDGWTTEQVLAVEWDLSVNAIFSAEMTAMRNINVRPASQVSINNMDSASDYYIYQVFVECAAVPAFLNTVQVPADTTSGNRPGRTFSNDRDSDDNRPSRTPRPARLSLDAERTSARPSR